MPKATSTGPPDTESGHRAAEELNQALDQFRARIDSLLVQLDLASMEIRDELRKRIETTENAYLAAKARLAEVRKDATMSESSVREIAETILRDLRKMFEAAESVIRRDGGQ